MSATNPQLRYRSLWLLIGYLLIVLVVYLSLVSSPIDIDTRLPYQDKLFHTFAYFSLTFWFMQIYHIRQHVLFWLIFFLCLGFFMEYLQSFDAGRQSEVGDMLANTLGVLLAFVLSRTRMRFILAKMEQLIH
ncbi:MAG: VanZ family protein [Thiotrichales bacterium]|nr:MAG: VanZ family protein [Thiotrichales bacterium]